MCLLIFFLLIRYLMIPISKFSFKIYEQVIFGQRNATLLWSVVHCYFNIEYFPEMWWRIMTNFHNGDSLRRILVLCFQNSIDERPANMVHQGHLVLYRLYCFLIVHWLTGNIHNIPEDYTTGNKIRNYNWVM